MPLRALLQALPYGRAAPLGHVATQLRSMIPILRQPVSCQPEGMSAAAACSAPDWGSIRRCVLYFVAT